VQALQGGVTVVQVREKNADTGEVRGPGMLPVVNIVSSIQIVPHNSQRYYRAVLEVRRTRHHQ